MTDLPVTDLPPDFARASLPGIGRPLTDHEAAQFHKYMNLLTKWQRVHRLIGSTEPAWIIENVFVDSLAFLQALPHDVNRVADVGSGAGIPGIPMAIARPDLEIGLIEARQRRTSFLATVVRELALPRVTVLPGRLEDLRNQHAGRYDAAVMRCAGKARALLSDALGLVRPGGVVVVSANVAEPAPREGEAVRILLSSGITRTFHLFRRL